MRRLVGSLLVLGLLGSPVLAVTTYKRVIVHTAAVVTLAAPVTNGSLSPVGAEIPITAGSAADGALYCAVLGEFTFAANPTAGGSVVVWLSRSLDGTTFDDLPPANSGRPTVTFPVSTGQVTTKHIAEIECPLGQEIRALLQNVNTGQTMSSGVISIQFSTIIGVES